MTPLHTEGFPNSLVIATEGNIIIGTIDDIQQLHINKVHCYVSVVRLDWLGALLGSLAALTTVFR